MSRKTTSYRLIFLVPGLEVQYQNREGLATFGAFFFLALLGASGLSYKRGKF